VFDAAGPSEVVRADVDGLRFRTVDELVSMTAGLIDAPDHRCRLGASAIERAEDFAPAAFRRRLLHLLDENGLS
jgi:hypothetical protein